jgi:S1-C subfamily serine protease
MNWKNTATRWPILCCLLGCIAVRWAAATGDASAATASPPHATPADLQELRALETRVKGAVARALPATVAVRGAAGAGEARSPRHHEPFGSGVIISADGLVLSQYHVSHALDTAGDFQKSRKAGEKTSVILHDGREVEAELLGADRGRDVSLLRLTGPGPYPHAPLEAAAEVAAGQWVLKLGHPGGYRKGRAAPARLGRVVARTDDTFVTDCLVSGGDSGGPLFDLDGRLVGIVRNSAVGENVRSKAGGRGGLPFSVTSALSIAARLEAMRGGQITGPGPEIAGEYQALAEAASLPRPQWTQGPDLAAAWADAVTPQRASVVTVLDGEDAVALGTVVGADGWVLTKASELPAAPRCRLPGGRVAAVRVAGVAPEFDLALLKADADGLRPITWADGGDAVPAGTLVAAPGPEAPETPVTVAVGMVSVPRRDLPGPHPTRVESPPARPAAPPEVIGSAVQGRGYWVEYADGSAAAAGVMPGDVIVSVGGVPVRRHQDLEGCVAGRRSGERVPVRLLRGGRSLALSLPLRAEGQQPFSFRNDDFPVVFEHDAPLLAHECGGPVVGIDGKALGVTLARVGPHGCMAAPAEVVQRLLPELMSGKRPMEARARPATTRPGATRPTSGEAATGGPERGGPVTLTLGELKQRLSERRARFKSLLVDYDVTSESHVEPELLLAWNLHHVRDYKERHRVAFAGDKRYSQVLRPAFGVWYAPQDRVAPDPAAPAAVAESVERQRTAAADRRGQGGTGHLFVRTSPETRFVFDGSACFRLESNGRMRPAPAGHFYAPVMYLASLGLRPIDPGPDEPQRKVQQRFSFPHGFALYDRCEVLPAEERADGAACVVVEAERKERAEGRDVTYADRFWLDPALDYAPRRWEQRVDGRLAGVRTNRDFESFAPGCWLAWESTWTFYAPTWAAEDLRERPAYSYLIRLRRARVNDVGDELFKP